jgi:16S rRNA (cytosine967-C5)-methyltransferase
MRDSSRLQAIIDLLQEIESAAQPCDAVISAYFRARRYIGSKDRQAVAGAVYDVLRHWYRLNWWNDYLGSHDMRTLIMLYLTLIQEEKPDAIQKLYNGDDHAPAELSENERKFLRGLTGRTLIHPQMSDAVKLECPEWAYAKLESIFGDRITEELQAMQEPAQLDIRVNALKMSRDDVKAALSAEKITARPTPFSPWGLRVAGRPPLSQLALFKDGAVEIQDEGSQLIALLCDAQPGMSVVDFCAGAGGKTLALAATMQNKGRLVACDVLGGRLQRAKLRFRRAGAHNISIQELNNENDQWVKRSAGRYDRVLVDAPCSGTGTWRRNPDARWKELGPKLDELVALQARILQSASRLVKPGGELIYATCSLLPDENNMQVESFLNANPDFTLLPAHLRLPEETKAKDYLSLSPAAHKTDGFFGAVMQKKA